MSDGNSASDEEKISNNGSELDNNSHSDAEEELTDFLLQCYNRNK